MKIAHITDIHIGNIDEHPFGVDVRENFWHVLKSVSKEKCDYIIITGDLCFRDPNITTYRWIKDKLDKLSLEYDVLSGNHDDNKMIAQVFNYSLDEDNKLYYSKSVDSWNLLFMDTSSSTITNNQLHFLKDYQYKDKTIIFTHYPLLPGRIKHMDKKYPFNDVNKVKDLLNNFKSTINVFSGHYHVEKTIIDSNINMFITPSTFFQIDQNNIKFTIDHKTPGWRVIELTQDSIYTTIKYNELFP